MHTEYMRKLINLFESVSWSPMVVQYVNHNPENIATNPQILKQRFKQYHQETGAAFNWGIARLPDGKYLSGYPRVLTRLGLDMIEQGTHEDL